MVNNIEEGSAVMFMFSYKIRKTVGTCNFKFQVQIFHEVFQPFSMSGKSCSPPFTFCFTASSLY